MKTILALAAAAVAVTAVPADAKPYNKHNKATVCSKWSHGQCVKSHSVSRNSALYRVGYRFTPRYAYTPYNSLPRTYVSRYNLNSNSRYVYRDNYIYVVNPRTNAVERIISALVR